MSEITIEATATITIEIDAEDLEDKGWYEWFHTNVDLNDYIDEFEVRVE